MSHLNFMGQITKHSNGGRRAVLTRGQINRIEKRRQRNKALYHEVVALAADVGIELGPDIGSIPGVVMRVFRRTHALWTHAASMVDQLDADARPGQPDSLWTLRYDENGNRIVEPSKWIEYERVLREELFGQAMQMSHLKLDERLTSVEEQKLGMLQTALLAAMKVAGVDEPLQRKIGQALRTELQALDSTSSLVSEVAGKHKPANAATAA